MRLIAVALLHDHDASEASEPWMPSSEDDPYPPASDRKSCVLLVDDDELVRTMLGRLLRAGGYEVIEAEHGGVAYQLLQAGSTAVDLVVTDLRMPVMDGRELGRRIRAQRPTLPIIYISGFDVTLAESQGLHGRGSAFMQKPFKPNALLEQVARMLDGG